MKLDSDKNIKVKGKVTSLTRGTGQEFVNDQTVFDLVTLVINSCNKDYHVDLPIETASDFAVIPYQSALIGAEVKYSKKYSDNYELHQNWKMKILSGPMKGQIYKKSGR